MASQQPGGSPDPLPIIELIEAFRRSKVMFAAVSLGVFDALARESLDVHVLAQRLAVKAEPLERLLNSCVALKLLRRSGEFYENEPVASSYLCRESDQSLSGYILYSNDVLYRLWGHIEDAVREGTPRWQQTFGIEASIFGHFFRTEEAKEVFIRGMHGLGILSSSKIVAAFDLSRFHRMVDLGGATGHLAIAACELYPELRAVVFDLPQVVATARAYADRSASAAPRIQVQAGDFFQDELPEADLFAMGRILHDWPEQKIEALLAKIFRRLPPGGGIVLAEKLVNEDKNGPISALLQSLNMLMCTEGKERTLNEYRKLLETAGFRDVRGSMTGSTLDVVFAMKPSR